MSAVAVNSDVVKLDDTSASVGNMPTLTAGSDFAAGEVVCRVGNQAFPCEALPASVQRNAYGIALHRAESGQPLRVATHGTIILALTDVLVPGRRYFAGATGQGGSGTLIPYGDLIVGALENQIGVAVNTQQLSIRIDNSSVARASA